MLWIFSQKAHNEPLSLTFSDLGDINENWFEELTESCKNILQSCSDHVKHQVHSRDRRVDLGRNEICPRAEFEQGTSETTATSHICENTDLEPSQALHITVSTSHVTKKSKALYLSYFPVTESKVAGMV